MKWALIYSKTDLDRNIWFANEIIRNFKKNNIQTNLEIEEEISFDGFDYDCVIYRGHNHETLNKLENLGIRCFNNEFVSFIANDKFETFKFLKEHGISVLPTTINVNDISSFPIVAKVRNGHGGTEVFLCKNAAELNDISKKYNNLIFQSFVKEGFKDIRAYVIGNEVIACIERTSTSNFKSNYSLGGDVRQIPISNEIISISKKISELLKSDFIGIDFFIVEGKYIVNEIEDPVGSRMLYKTTEIDFAKEIVDYCMHKAKAFIL